MRALSTRALFPVLAWGFVGLVLLLAVAFVVAAVDAWVHPALVAREHAERLAGETLSKGRAVAVVLAGALPLPAALYGCSQGFVLLQACRRPGGCLPAGARPMRNLGIAFAATALLGLAAGFAQAMVLSGRAGFAWALGHFDPCSDSLGLFLLASVVALVGQSLCAHRR